MSKEQVKFCHVSKYIEKTDPKFFQMLEDYCMISALKPKRMYNGLTFIYPGKETMKKLSEYLHSEDIEKGVNILMDHIVHDFLPTVKDWEKYKEDVPNDHDHKVEVSVKDGKVHVYDGVEIVPDSKFKQFVPPRFKDGEVNQCVWRVEGKKEILDHKEGKKASFQFAKKGAHGKEAKGGHFSRPAADYKQYISHQLSKFCSYVFQGSDGKIDNPLFEDLVSFYTFLKLNDPKKHDELMSQMSPAPVSSFIYTFNNAGSHFEKWYSSYRFPVDQPVSSWHKMLNAAATEIKDGASEIKAQDFDVNRANFFNKIKAYYEQVIEARGGDKANATKLFSYNLGILREASILIPCIQEIRAVKGAGLHYADHHTLGADIKALRQAIEDPKPIFLDPKASGCDPECIATLTGIFKNSDLFGYQLRPVQVGSGDLVLRTTDGELVKVLPYLAWFNVNEYDDAKRDPRGIIPQLAGLSDDVYASLIEQVTKLRSDANAQAAKAALPTPQASSGILSAILGS